VLIEWLKPELPTLELQKRKKERKKKKKHPQGKGLVEWFKL
jgi:hypothetical protein